MFFLQKYRNKRHQMKVVESLASFEAFPLLSKNDPRGRHDALNCRMPLVTNMASIPNQVTRSAWKVPLDIYNFTADGSILDIHYLHQKKQSWSIWYKSIQVLFLEQTLLTKRKVIACFLGRFQAKPPYT